MKTWSPWLVVAVLALTVLPARAMFMWHQTESVPIARVLANLQQRLTTNNQNVEVLYQLARVYSMAYATNATTFKISKDDGQPVFGDPGSDAGVPRKVAPHSPEQQAVARQHLTNAISHYERAKTLVLKGTNATAHQWLIAPIHLGYAWCLDQAGRRKEAIEAYRDALEYAWRQEVEGELTFRERAEWSWDRLRAGKNPLVKPKRGHIGPGACYSDEIIGYLLALLDPQKDAKEIAQLQSDRQQLRTMPRAITPILIPLQSGVALDQLVDADACVKFDLDGSGEQRHWGWITTNAAWLVFDRDGNERIASGLQMFGNVTFWIFWRDGFHALSSLDNDGDGKLSDDELRGLALWNDRNSDGVSDAGEVTPVSRLGIVAIDCGSERHSTGIQFNELGATFRDGSSRATYDWIAPSR